MVINEYEQQFKEITGFDFNEFYKEHKPKLTWHLSSLTKDLRLAEDFADEAFVQSLVKLHQYDPKRGAQIHTWIYTIGRNLCIKDYKESQRLPATSLDKEYESNLTLANFLSYDDGKKELAKENELVHKAELVKKAIQELPPKYKEVMEMRELEHMQYKQIANSLDRNLSTVKSQIKKGRSLVVKKVERKFNYIDENGFK
jgi:RNA polymerase sigma-70 factor, ECF subfamily